jgi:hypothetical protein
MMRALTYLLGARAFDTARDGETGIRWPKPADQLGPIASTAETAAAWRRWRDRAGDSVETSAATPETAPGLIPKRA